MYTQERKVAFLMGLGWGLGSWAEAPGGKAQSGWEHWLVSLAGRGVSAVEHGAFCVTKHALEIPVESQDMATDRPKLLKEGRAFRGSGDETNKLGKVRWV